MGRLRTNTFEKTDKESWRLSSFFLLDHLPLANCLIIYLDWTLRSIQRTGFVKSNMTSNKKEIGVAIDAAPDVTSGEVILHIDPEDERRVVRKLDWNLLPLCMVAFVLN